MRPSAVVLLYWWRLRAQPLQELLAATGIAAGVALLFAVQVANSSISGSVEQLVHGITGQFSLQVSSHDSRGFTEALTAEVAKIDGVKLAAPVLEQRVGIAGPRGHANVQLGGVTNAVSDGGGPLVRDFGGRFGPRLADALLIPKPLAAQLGAKRGSFVTLATRLPTTRRVPVSVVLSRAQIGSATDSPLVVAPLAYVQRLTGLPGRLARILIAVRPGSEQHVRAALTTLVAGRLAVERSDVEIAYIKQAAAPNDQSTGLFAGICVIVGVLFTFNAMLLTVPERRRLVAELRMQGYTRRQVLVQLLCEATALGVVAALIGLLLGDLLSRHVFHSVPGYLSFAFPVGGQRIVHAQDLLLAFVGGIVATLIATAPLLRDLFSRGPVDAVHRGNEEPGEAISARTRAVLAVVGVVLLLVTAVVVALAPSLTVMCVGLLAVAMLALVPASLAGMLTVVDRLCDWVRGSSLPLAVMELRSALTRATALAATGALALFGTVAIQGAHRDLLQGLDRTAAGLMAATDVWVTAPGDENLLLTTPFSPPSRRALLASGAVAGMRVDRSQFLDMAGRRAWVFARPPTNPVLIPPGDVQEGGIARATRLVRSGGWAAVSASIADHMRVGVGDRVTIPTPSGPKSLRVAGIVSNLGWPPGTLVVNGNDYRRWWPGRDVGALEITLKPGIPPAAGKAAIERVLPASSPLLVETRSERKARFARLERQGLNRLSQISTLLLIAAVLAMGAAMAGTVWQQRRRLATLRVQGYSTGRILRLLLVQAFLVLTTGSLMGAVFGLCGQALGTRWLQLTTGFPTSFDFGVALAATTLATVAALALVVVLIPGWFAARTGPSLAFRTD
jgi:putative ABC transport system permease protein